ncbi:MAG: HAD-IB family phosphatase [Methanomassiliicoccaceae archaeon]|nr:HAD-IB family phosphatase [Methanomassiliicoccaceae archaeon]
MRRYDLVCFDMDGVLTSIRSSWHWINLCLGVDNSRTLQAYVDGEIDQLEFMRRDIAQWKAVVPGIGIPDIVRILQGLPLTGGIQETVACLKSHGTKCVIISGGIDLAARMIADEFGFDDYVADEICSHPDGSLTGEGRMNVDLDDKGINVRHFIGKYGATKERTASIGNSFIDIPMFENTGTSIAFNPTDEHTGRAADFTVTSDNLADILDILLPQDGGQPSSPKSNPS